MKTRKWFWALCLILTPSLLQSQTCVDPQKTRTYDTTVIGSGNAFNTFTFPKFDPSSGTLMSVTISTEITLLYSFELENRDLSTIPNYRVKVMRDDEITSPVLSTGYLYSFTKTFGPYVLTGWDGIAGSGTDYKYVPLSYIVNHASRNEILNNTADFLGTGSVSFDYSTSSYSSVLGSVNYTFNANAQDTVHFSITYTFCPSWFLKADISSFQATKKRNNTINLQWTTQNELPDRMYEIQQSFDGRSFLTVEKKQSQPNNSGIGSYSYEYLLPSTNSNHQIIFRLKEIEKDGTEKYSAVRVVALEEKEGKGFRLYPNPATNMTRIQFKQQQRSNWDVEIISFTGITVRRYSLNNTSIGKLEGLDTLPKGIYLVKAKDRKTQTVYEQPLLKQ